MGQFSVNYQGLSTVASSEDRIAQAVSDAATQIAAVTANVAAQPSLWGKGYTDKLWKAYGQVGNIQSDITRMSLGLKKVHDAYMEYESQVLNKAEGTLTVKNGFTKGAAKTVAKASAVQEKQAESKKQVKKATIGSILYDSTFKSWGRNIKAMKNILKETDAFKEGTGKTLTEYIYDKMRDAGFPEGFMDKLEGIVDKASKVADNFQDVMMGILDITNPDSVKEGIVSFGELIGLDGEHVQKSIDLFTDLADRQRELEERIVSAIQNGNYLEAATTFGGSFVETIGIGSLRTGAAWIDTGLNSGVDFIKENLFDDGGAFSGVTEEIENLAGIDVIGSMGNVVEGIGGGLGHLTAEIADDFGSVLDTLPDLFAKPRLVY